MLTDKQKEFIDFAVNDTLRKNLPEIEKNLWNGVNDGMSLQQQRNQVLINAITISVQVSVQMMMEVLDHLDLAHLPEDDASLLRSQIHLVDQER
jgi:hypothetical protein